MTNIHYSPILEAFEVLDSLTEGNAAQAVHAGHRFVPTPVIARIRSEVMGKFYKKRDELLAALRKLNRDDNGFRRLAEAERGRYKCCIGVHDPDYPMYARTGEGEDAGVTVSFVINMYIDGEPWRGRNIYIRNTAEFYKTTEEAQKLIDETIEQAYKILCDTVKAAMPTAKVSPITMFKLGDLAPYVEIDYRNVFDAAWEEFQKAVREYEVTDDDIRAEEERMNNVIRNYYASKGPGDYTGD